MNRRAFAQVAVSLIEAAFFLSFATAEDRSSVSDHVALVDQSPIDVRRLDDDTLRIDFGRVGFGNLQVIAPERSNGPLVFHLGERSTHSVSTESDPTLERVDRDPPGTIRYHRIEVVAGDGERFVVAPPPDRQNTTVDSDRHPPAVLLPESWGVVTPFRWVEVEGWPADAATDDAFARRTAVAKGWDDDASAFECSDPMLNEIWDLCRYSIKATTFAGVYVDGDRERIPYEADAYLNQLSHYYTDGDVGFARRTFDHLMRHPTWPSEWAPHMVLMAHADWMRTGDAEWLRPRYDALIEKTLIGRVGADGLVRSDASQIAKTDIVDWPRGERDGYQFTATNTVVNAFHLAAARRMAELADALGRTDEAERWRRRFADTLRQFNERLFDADAGRYVDGEGTDHASMHANAFPLAFDLVPTARLAGVIEHLRGRGMAGSVYAAQYLLEGLFCRGDGTDAVRLITADGDRSWKHMVESGTTITWEAWDMRYKPNQDWNHAWGAAPANLLPRFVLGVRPATPGWGEALIDPRVSGLRFARGRVPTPRGPIEVRWDSTPTEFRLRLDLPDGVSGRVAVPTNVDEGPVRVNGRTVFVRTGQAFLGETTTGTTEIRFPVTRRAAASRSVR